MRKNVVVLLLAVLALPAFAGCLGGDDAPEEDTGDTCGAQCDVDADISEGLGGIRGQIVDETLAPIEGANVTLSDLSLTTKTDEAGRYAFNDLEPGQYTVFAQNPPVHAANGKQVNVVADSVVSADLILEIVPPPAQPYLEERQFTGVLGCAFSFQFAQTGDYCQQALPVVGQLDNNAVSTFQFPMDAGLTALHVILDSQAGVTGNTALRMDWLVPVGGIPPMAGQSPISAEHEFNADEDAWTASPQDAQFSVRADPDAGTPQLAYQQKFDIYMGLFYNGEPVPAGYSPGVDG